MDHAAHNKIVSFIWGIADDVLRDLFVRGKYRDVILPMCVLRRLDAVLEPTKQAVLDTQQRLDAAKITEQRQALRSAAGEAFYNTSRFTLRDLTARGSQQQLKADFEDYLDGFSDNVQEILDNFEFRNILPRLSKADALGTLVEKFLDPDINLSPQPVLHSDGGVKHPGLDNHAMGTIFEELVRKFNEDNNEEAGEHWTPRDAVALMARLIFDPIADRLKSGSYTLYDGAAGTGGMLTVAEETLEQIAKDRGLSVQCHLHGQEINPETYAICKADMLLKGEGQNADHIVGGAEHSTLAADAFPAQSFDFMLSNPPYGKSWKKDLDQLGGKADLSDPRFRLELDGIDTPIVTRSSDGQLMFMANLLAKMADTPLGTRIAEVHNGSSLFTGDAGSGESNLRRYVIENDLVEAVVALPLNLFYNTGIATYVWVLTNRKPKHRRGKTQLIDATAWSRPLRKNLGKKNCELAPEDTDRILHAFTAFTETKESKIFPNRAFGYWKITVDRPLRLRVDLDVPALERFGAVCHHDKHHDLAAAVARLAAKLGPGPHRDYNAFLDALKKDAKKNELKLTAQRKKLLIDHLAVVDPDAEPVKKAKPKAGSAAFEHDPALRDTEQVPLTEVGGIRAFVDREVLPHVPDAWIDESKTQIGYEISFTRHFYQPPVLRSLDAIKADIAALEKRTEGLLTEITGGI